MASNLLHSVYRSASQVLASYRLSVKKKRMVHDVAQEETNERVNKLDDGFFEDFTATLNKHERIQAERRQKDDEEIDEETSGSRISWQQVSCTSCTVADATEEKEFEEIYRALIRAVHYRIGATDRSATANLHTYMRKVISVSDEQHSVWMHSEIQEAMPPRTLLRVSVKKGKKLPAKDSNDLSDPFCVFALVEVPPNYLDGKSKTMKLKKLVKDKSQMQQTHVIEKTLNPEWNETFNIDIDQRTVHKKVLQIDIWDSDENVSSIKDAVKADVKSAAGFFRFVGQLGETALHGAKPDFMGHVFIPIREVPEQGVEQWYPVLNRRQKELQGGAALLIGLRFVAQQTVPIRSASFSDAFSRHIKIYQLFWQLENEEHTESGGKRWNMQLSPPAAKLLHLHASQHDLTPLEEAIIDWIVVAQHHEHNDVDYNFMINVANKVQQEFETALRAATNPRDVLDPVKVQMFISSCQQFHEWCFRALSKLRVIYPAKQKKPLERLSAMLRCCICGYHSVILAAVYTFEHCRCLQKTYSFPIMKHELEESLPRFISGAIEKSTDDWFERQEALFEPQVKTPDTEIQAFVDVALAVVVDISHGMKVYSQMMKPLGVDYLSLVFKNLDSLLSPNIEAKMQKYNRTLEAMDVESAGFKTLSTASFELYLALKELYKFKPNLPAEVASDVQLFKKMYVWFKPLVARWIELANVKARKQICRAIEIDEKKRLSDEALYSTSAIDTVQCLFQVCKFWVSIDWPIPSAAYAFVVNLTDVICSNARHYAECMQGILNKTGYYDDEGQFDVTEQLCVTLNDIYYVETSLANVADSLNWDKVIEAIGLEKGEAGKVQTRASLFRVVASTEEDLTIRCNAIARTIGQKMAVDIHAYSLPLVRNAENISLDVSITGLMGYLCSNLSTLNSNLMAIGFKSVLLEIYHVTIGKILDIVKDEHNLAPVVCERLDKAVKEILVPFFHSQGNGLQKEEMATDQFKHLDSILSLRKKESSYLIGQYMYELAEEQEKSRVVERGTLTVQMGFIARKKSLCIKVLNCRNLPVMDNTGSSDPFVTVEPFPYQLFQDISVNVQKTAVHKETISPLFDETFFIPCEASNLTVEGASILFTCYDWDRFTKDDLIGEAVCLLSEASSVDTEADIDHLKQIMLPLSLPSEPEDRHTPYNVLQSRSWDKVATEFIKMRKKTFKMADLERK